MMKRILLLLFWLTALANSQGTAVIHTLADITGDAATHAVFSTGGTARWVSIVTCGSTNCASANASPVRIGDSNTSATRGQPIAPGGSFFLPVLASDTREGQTMHLYNLSSIYYYAATGDKISVAWGQ